MSERIRPALKIAVLLLVCLAGWRVTAAFGGDPDASLLREDIGTLSLVIAKAEKTVRSERDAEELALPESFQRLAASPAFGPKPKPKPPKKPPEPKLVGIAGATAFIRLPNGKVEGLQVGAESDGVKLVQIGVNRVLIRKDDQESELTIFSGLGGESLLDPKSEDPENQEDQQ